MKQTIHTIEAKGARSGYRLKQNSVWKQIMRGRTLYLLLLPGLLYFIIFKYAPMWGALLAFKKYSVITGFWESRWVGLEHFEKFFTGIHFWRLLKNTLIISLLNLLFFFPVPIIFALLLNEIRLKFIKGFIQTVAYVPHFFSWVVVVGITFLFLSTQDGIVNREVAQWGSGKIAFLTTPEYFPAIYVFQNIWKEAGYNAVFYLAAMTSIDPSLYEAAVMDGASRWKRMMHVTLPALKTTIVVLFILQLGHVLDIGFEHIYLMLNPTINEVADVFDTYVYREGIVKGNLSYATAVGLFKSVVALALIMTFNKLARKSGEEGVY
ncbi:MAG: protein lplB [Paenibacillus sp.]|nr:protein lplB [Paenibacillus sp.]